MVIQLKNIIAAMPGQYLAIVCVDFYNEINPFLLLQLYANCCYILTLKQLQVLTNCTVTSPSDHVWSITSQGTFQGANCDAL